MINSVVIILCVVIVVIFGVLYTRGYLSLRDAISTCCCILFVVSLLTMAATIDTTIYKPGVSIMILSLIVVVSLSIVIGIQIFVGIKHLLETSINRC